MCWISWINLVSWQVDVTRLEAANVSMRHRGPDASSTWLSETRTTGFGHVRLSIVDVQSRSNQPFVIDDGDYVAVFNGEIYNYLELRATMERDFGEDFSTYSDTEVLVRAYKRYGVKCLDLFQWMFAFAIFDRQKDEIFLARDFVGQKPLVYICDETGFYFASEIPALFDLHPRFQKKIDQDVMHFFFIQNFSHIPDALSIFEGIYKLPPASYMIIRNGAILAQEQYASLKKMAPTDPKKMISHLYDRLEQMKPKEISYASFLSWWIDSTFICNGLQHNKDVTNAYTLKSSEQDEDYSRSILVSERLGLKHHSIEMRDMDMLESIDSLVQHLWEPYFHITSVFSDRILGIASKQHKVMFTGAWGDECLYGYDNLSLIFVGIYFFIVRLLPGWMIEFFDKITKGRYSTVLLSNLDSFKKNYFLFNYQRVKGVFLEDRTVGVVDRIDQVLLWFKRLVNYDRFIDLSYMFGLFIENMHSLVIQGDLVGMKNSMEIRSLFLERDIIEMGYSMRLGDKVSPFRLHEWKEPLRRELLNFFPRSFVYGKKIGFGSKSEFIDFFTKNYQWKIIERVSHLPERGFFSGDQILRICKNFPANFTLIMKLYVMETWFLMFLDQQNCND